MTNEKWQNYLGTAHYPASLTSTDETRRNEALEYITKATIGFDKRFPLLVLGCGDGYELKLLRGQGFLSVKGISYHPDEIKLAQQQGIDGVYHGDIHELPFNNEEFEYVISKETLEHMISPTIALSEINRVLKYGGKFVHYIPSGIDKQRDWYHYNCFPDWLWVDFFYKAGFKTERIIPDIKQLRYSGTKHREFGWLDKIYDLDGELKSIKRV